MHLVKRFGQNKVCYLLQDAYYRDQSHISYDERTKLNYDHPDALELDLLIHHLAQLGRDQAIKKPVYDYKTHTRVNSNEMVYPNDIIVVEGVFILGSARLREMADLKVFVQTDSDLCFIRRLSRDLRERGRSMERVVEQYINTVKPMQNKYVLPFKEHADYIVRGDDHFKDDLDNLVRMISRKINYG
jgi:uridine kinase